MIIIKILITNFQTHIVASLKISKISILHNQIFKPKHKEKYFMRKKLNNQEKKSIFFIINLNNYNNYSKKKLNSMLKNNLHNKINSNHSHLIMINYQKKNHPLKSKL